MTLLLPLPLLLLLTLLLALLLTLLLLALRLLLLAGPLILRLGLALSLTRTRSRRRRSTTLLALLENHVARGCGQGEKRLSAAGGAKHDAERGAADTGGADGRVDGERGALPVLQLLHIAHEFTAVEAQAGDGSRWLLLQLRDLDRRTERILQKFLEDQFGVGPQPGRRSVGEHEHRRRVGERHDLGRLRDLHVHRERGGLAVDRHLNPALDLSHQHDARGQPASGRRLRGRRRQAHEGAREEWQEETKEREFHGRVGRWSRSSRRSASENHGSRRKPKRSAASAASRLAGRRAKCAP